MYSDPVAPHSGGQSPRRMDQTDRPRVVSHAYQDPLSGGPDLLDPLVLPVQLHLFIDPVGRPAQGKFPQGDEVALAEKVLDCRGRLFRHIDLSFSHALQQVVGGKVDEFDLIGPVEQKIRHGFPYIDARDLGDYVVQAFEVLDVHGCEDGDSGAEQLIDVLPALFMAGAGCVRVGQFVNEKNSRLAMKCAVEVEFLEDRAAILDVLAGQDFQSFEERFGFLPSVGLNETDHDLYALAFLLAGGLEHGIGLPHAGRGPEEDLELPFASPLLFLADPSQQLIGIRPLFFH